MLELKLTRVLFMSLSSDPSNGVFGRFDLAAFLQLPYLDVCSLCSYSLQAVKQAHGSMRISQLSVSSGELLEANINRSPTAYLNNPAEERARYQHDTDKNMTILKIKDSSKGRGLLSWFAVHPTSLGNSNTYLSGDNKGLAEQFTERGWGQVQAKGKQSSSKKGQKKSNSSSSNSDGFVAAFVQPNHGDTSPNVRGTFCGVTNNRCDVATSTCSGDNTKCLGRGPAWPNDLKSTEVLGRKMANKAEVRVCCWDIGWAAWSKSVSHGGIVRTNCGWYHIFKSGHSALVATWQENF